MDAAGHARGHSFAFCANFGTVFAVVLAKAVMAGAATKSVFEFAAKAEVDMGHSKRPPLPLEPIYRSCKSFKHLFSSYFHAAPN
jgi:hypothetical protein